MVFEQGVAMKVKGLYSVLPIFLLVMLLGVGPAFAQVKKDTKSTSTGKTTSTASQKTGVAKKPAVQDSAKKAVKPVDSLSKAKGKTAVNQKTAAAAGKKTPDGKTVVDPKKTPVKPVVVKLAPDLIKPNSVGILKLGMRIDTIKKLFPKDRVYRVYVYDAKDKYEQYQVTAADKSSQFLLINPECDGDSICSIRQIVAKNVYFKTERDIKVGMMLDDLILAYGFLESRWEEENLIVRNREGIDFVMDTSDIPKRWYRKMNLDRLPLPTRIIGIMITVGSPQTARN
ncbi:hypothetical protein [Solitalea canadensis]|uniref:Uncharacterized protein n=1 Tax=Solitalea canadensis (strain ATCC 29591 / DSM 3403 / JCM 21819 / LMG 8368 / NBRC 15130 / NCIMB 12057 / USAM 9D) TaxID=929556 RepID=H8KRL6_SOLCM|nr:hypothetical protein [Solitalea canadensis]AFD07597.1 hypothetical protein Solca_2563 [Solitalea canadensis DSM 3403]